MYHSATEHTGKKNGRTAKMSTARSALLATAMLLVYEYSGKC